MSRRRRSVICQQLVELVTDYLEGDLDPLTRAAVEDHLAACGHCRGYVEQVRTMLDLTAGLGQGDELPPGLLDTVTARFRQRS